MKLLKKIILSVIVLVFSSVWSVQFAGVCGALIKSLNNVSTTSSIIVAVTAILFIIGLFLVWSNRLSLDTLKSADISLFTCNLYFASLIILVIAYMALLKDIKYVLLAECLVTWVIWFVIMGCIKKTIGIMSSNKEGEESSSVEPSSDSGKENQEVTTKEE